MKCEVCYCPQCDLLVSIPLSKRINAQNVDTKSTATMKRKLRRSNAKMRAVL
jgi:hypothetical protein